MMILVIIIIITIIIIIVLIYESGQRYFQLSTRRGLRGEFWIQL